MADPPNDPWAELGIPSTADPAAIRRAYASRLKLVRPDKDPQRFVALREAYEQALAQSSSDAVKPGTGVAPPRVHSSEDDRAGRDEAQSKADPVRPDRVADHLSRGDVVGAALWLVSGQSAGSASLDEGLQASDRLGWAMAQDLDLDAAAVREAARQLDWPASAGKTAWAAPLQARVDAQDWLDALRQMAETDPEGVTGRERSAADFLLGHGRTRGLWKYQNETIVRRYYGEYLLHAPIIRGAFDPVRIDQVAAMLKQEKESITVFTILALLVLLTPVALAGYLVGLVHPALGIITSVGLIVGLIIWACVRPYSGSASVHTIGPKR